MSGQDRFLESKITNKTYTSKFLKKPFLFNDKTVPNYMRPVTHEIRVRPINPPRKYEG